MSKICTHSGFEKASQLRQHDTVEGDADQRVHQHQYASGTGSRVQISIPYKTQFYNKRHNQKHNYSMRLQSDRAERDGLFFKSFI